MLQAVVDRWWVLLVRGICAVLIGIGALAWPQMTLWILIVLYGAFTLADGVGAVMLGVAAKREGRVWWEMIALGALAILAGIAAAVWPGVTLLIFVTIAGVSAIVRGVFEILAAIQLRKVIEGEWLLALSGLASIGFGILLLAYPVAGAVAFAYFIGAYMITVGIMAIVLSLRVRSLKSRTNVALPR